MIRNLMGKKEWIFLGKRAHATWIDELGRMSRVDEAWAWTASHSVAVSLGDSRNEPFRSPYCGTKSPDLYSVPTRDSTSKKPVMLAGWWVDGRTLSSSASQVHTAQTDSADSALRG